MELKLDEQFANAGPHTVQRMDVDGFWKDRRLAIGLDRNANFLIGPNGSGKTTMVNLLAGVLTADLRVLDRIEFSSVRVELAGVQDGRSVLVEVKKEKKERLPLPQISYTITDVSSGNMWAYALDDIEEQLAIRDARYLTRRRLPGRASPINAALSTLIDVSWLSVHRHEAGLGDRSEATVESLVDAKLDAQANQLVRYFSRLDQRASDVLRQFQQGIFLNLLANPETNFDLWEEFDFDIERDRSEFIAILDQFKVQRSRYQSKIEKHFDLLRRAQQKTSDKQGISSTDVVALVNQRRIHDVVAEWNDAGLLQKEIFRTRDAFFGVLNKMLIGKEIYITNTNELGVRTETGRNLPIRSLSSGEKQLLIIMGQALLQDARAAVFIADEPELSLHVSWQEALVDNIKTINPAAQIIFATHSPDVVGSHLDQVIESHEVFVA